MLHLSLLLGPFIHLLTLNYTLSSHSALDCRYTILCHSSTGQTEDGVVHISDVAALNSQSCHANIRPVTSHFVYKPPDLGPTFVKPECCRYAFTKPAQTLASPVHQLLSYCPSDQPFLIGSVFTEPRMESSIFQTLPHSTATAVTPTSVRSLLTSCTNLLIRAPHL
jgi:hypothetical protein